MKPLISIITVTFNAKQTLERTILSIPESYDLELIIMDGGSTDGTIDIIKKYTSRITHWVSERDGGIYDAMNNGLRHATGEYVWFINAGDRMHDGAKNLRILINLIQSENPDIIYGETAIINSNGENVGMRRLKAPLKLSWHSFRWGMLVCHQSMLVRRSIAPEYDLQYRLVADFDWAIRSMKRALHIVNSHLILSDFEEGGTSTQHLKSSLKERFRIMTRHYGWIPTIIRHFWFATRFYWAKIKKE